MPAQNIKTDKILLRDHNKIKLKFIVQKGWDMQLFESKS